MIYVIPVILVILAIGVIAGVARRRQAQTNAPAWANAVQALAAQLGWGYGTTDPLIEQRVHDIYRITGARRLGLGVQITGPRRGTHGLAIELPVLQTQVAYSTVAAFTVVLIPRPAPGPRLTIAPQGLTWLTAFHADVQIGDPAFDARFHVQTPDPAFARAVLHPGLTGPLAADPRLGQGVLVFDDRELALVLPGGITQAPVAAAVDLLIDVSAQVPWR
ncbi:hypothetical protein F0L68_39950 [Solihabitans fulvus]|uniref:DUF3137 domain-containing protein n=1 Tax=Solihabitans fulvus TaxID=1892852 RepID=A0A5B2WC45_9PSEU|nr:hypothetical protein [Solihabitans fulvus]KAA2248448.1 hypothetical protein F0L68_39950 [Solihabitans fulvus]